MRFLNREVEYEQLKSMVRECEERLRNLREQEVGELSGLQKGVDNIGKQRCI